MKLSAQLFLHPKAGLESHECEDSIGFGSDVGRYCIADGATEGFGSRRWSKLLTKYWAKNTGALQPDEFTCLVNKLAERFDRYWQRKTLPWYAEEKLRKGAFAAFVGVQFFEKDSQLHWQSIAQGDCCLFHIRSRQIIRAFPLESAEQFNNNPILIASNAQQRTDQDTLLVQCEGTLEAGDRFLLMSDAIAAWFLNTIDNNRETISSFYQAMVQEDEAGLKKLIEEERNEKRLKNDDVAIILISTTGIG